MAHTALVTTTIGIPTVLSLYRAYGPGVGIFVVGDTKTPEECEKLVTSLGMSSYYYSVEKQKSLNYKCSELLGWSCIARRNIGTLEALDWGADVIVFCDDDNIPMNEFYFADHVNALTKPHSGIKVTGIDGWFNIGKLLHPFAPHRGFPHNASGDFEAASIVDASVGVNAGICMGDPDISAYFRMANHPLVHRASELLNAGVVADNEMWTVFNSQNTAFIRELAPAMFMMPGIGRMDDIWASLICQRIMRERGLHVKFGRPYVWQERNQHDLVKDLRAEIIGMDHTVGFSQYLDLLSLSNMSVIEAVRCVYKSDETFLPTNSVRAALAFLEDCETVMR